LFLQQQQCLQDVFGVELVRELQEITWRAPRGAFEVHGFLPAPGEHRKLAVRSASDRTFLYVNRRPVDFPALTRLLWRTYRQHIGASRKHYAFVYLELVLPLNKVDVNMSPNKRIVQLEDEDEFLGFLAERLTTFYPQGAVTRQPDSSQSTLSQKRKLSRGDPSRSRSPTSSSSPSPSPSPSPSSSLSPSLSLCPAVSSSIALPMQVSDDEGDHNEGDHNEGDHNEGDHNEGDHEEEVNNDSGQRCVSETAFHRQGNQESPTESARARGEQGTAPEAISSTASSADHPTADSRPSTRARTQAPRGVHLLLRPDQLREYMASATATLESAALTLSQQVCAGSNASPTTSASQLPDLALFAREQLSLLGRLPLNRGHAASAASAAAAAGSGALSPAEAQYWIIAVERDYYVLDVQAAGHLLLRTEQHDSDASPLISQQFSPPLSLLSSPATASTSLALASGAGRLTSTAALTSVLPPVAQRFLASIIDPLEMARLCTLLEQLGGFVVRAAPWRLLSLRPLYPEYGLTELRSLLTRLQRERALSLSGSLLECNLDAVEWQYSLLELVAYRRIYSRADVLHLLDHLHPISSRQTDPAHSDRPLLRSLATFDV